MGLTQHKNGVGNVQEIVNFLLMRGSIGIPGAGTCPVRGHSNVQGDRTMGIHDRPSKAFLDRIQDVFGFDPPREHGFNTVEAIQAMLDGRAKVFFAMGGNFLQATPDTQRTAQALQNCEMLVHVSTKLNRGHLLHNKWSIIMPCLARSEVDEQAYGPQFVTVENSMGVVHSSRGKMKPAHEGLYSEPAIVAWLAEQVLGPDAPVSWCWLIEDYDRIRDLIAKTIPHFEDFNERVREPGGFHLYNGARERQFNTDGGKAKFTINETPDLSLPDGAFRMMTMRTHDQYNTTVYGNDDRYRGIKGGRRIVFMNEEDMREADLLAGALVDIRNDFGGKYALLPDSRWSRTPSHAAASVRTFPRPTCSFRSSASPRAASHPPRKTSSSDSAPALRGGGALHRLRVHQTESRLPCSPSTPSQLRCQPSESALQACVDARTNWSTRQVATHQLGTRGSTLPCPSRARDSQ